MICNSFIKINFVANILSASLTMFNKMTAPNNDHCITYKLFAALFTALPKVGLPDCF